jgi:hypothetical protein
MVDPVSILVGLLEFLLNVVLGFVLDFLWDFLTDVLWDLLEALWEALLEVVDPLKLLAIALLVLGVVATFVPFLPGPLVSIAGVLLYWYATNFQDPSVGWVVLFVALGGAAMAFDYLGTVISARIGGASTRTSVAAALVGLVLTFVVGPIGFLLGVAGTVFGMEYYRHEDGERAARSAVVTFAGMLGSAVAQAVLTGAILVLMVWFVFV